MKWLSKRWQFTLMVAPAFLLYSLYLIYPVVYSLYYSFSDYDGLKTPKLIGLANYSTMAHDTLFWSSLRNTAIILIIALIVLIPLAFLLAALLSGDIRGSAAMRPLIFAPAIVAPILVGLIWIYILDPHIGLINAVLAAAGVPARPEWIGGTTLSPYSMAGVYIWEQVGFIVTIFYAGIRSLPEDVIEASALDGASAMQRLRYIVVPMLQETFGIVTALVFTGVFKIFELVYELTGGGPVHLSETLVSYTYGVTFAELRYGYGMALSVVIALLGVVGAIASLTLLRRRAEA
jgi:raffinose/stachyose/melibiose transport system permease protein